MAGPWEKYAAPAPAVAVPAAGPWAKYAKPAGNQALEAASAASQQLQGKVSDLPSRRPSFADEAMSFGRGVIEGIPIAGPALSDARRGLDANVKALIHGGDAGAYQDEFKAADEELRSKTGGARTAGSVTGAVTSLAPLGATALGGRLLGTVGTLPQRLIAGAGSGAVISGADTAARGGGLEDVALSAGLGAGLGAVFPAIGGVRNAMGNRAAQAKATTAAIAGAPAASELKNAASQMFQAVDQAGVTVEPQAFQSMVIDLAKKARDARINPNLDPKAYAAFEELGGIMGEVANGRPLTLSELHNMRQIAQKAAVSAEGRDAFFANKIVDALDEFVTLPGATTAPGGEKSGQMLLDAIGTWGRARRTSLVEEAMARAQNAASGFENGLRVEFRKLLNNKKLAKLFTPQEKAEFARVVQGTTAANLTKLLGKFGFSANNMMGGTVGGLLGGSVAAGGNPLGGIALAAVGTASRKASEKLTEKAAERAAKIVATPNMPVVAPRALPPGALPPALLPLEATKKREPINIVVRGGRG